MLRNVENTIVDEWQVLTQDRNKDMSKRIERLEKRVEKAIEEIRGKRSNEEPNEERARFETMTKPRPPPGKPNEFVASSSELVKKQHAPLSFPSSHSPPPPTKDSPPTPTARDAFPKWTPFDFARESRPGLNVRNAVSTCKRCLWRTLTSATTLLGDGGTFVITGDIDDLWLRDSAAQINPYISLAAENPTVARVVRGLIQRHAFYIRFDPWANAFRIDTSYKFNAEQKSLGRHGYISTRNYELDSGCYFVRMIYRFWKTSPNESILRSPEVVNAAKILVQLWRAEQRHESDSTPRGELFDCKNCGRPYRHKTLQRGGKGTKTGFTGMTWSGFRPSDDIALYGYNVPGNMFAVVSLRSIEEMARNLWHEETLATDAAALASEIDEGIRKHGIVAHRTRGRIYAYEVDGLGHFNMMDDANVPSLLSIPYIGYDYDPEIYAATRAFVLSRDNPTFRSSRDGSIEGVGSPHLGVGAIKNNIWPMGIITRGLTSNDLEEKLRVVDMLLRTTGGTGWMHESIDPSNPGHFTRPFFCWADALFAELVLSMDRSCLEKPWPSVKS